MELGPAGVRLGMLGTPGARASLLVSVFTGSFSGTAIGARTGVGTLLVLSMMCLGDAAASGLGC